jgi:hypothetical protein
MNITKCSSPKGYRYMKLSFSSIESADNYFKSLKEKFLLQKAKMSEYPNSKRKKKIIKFAQPNKYLLTKQGSRFLLWEKLN